MSKFNYRTLRDSVLLVLAYYQKFDSASPYIPEGMAKENPKTKHEETVIEIEQAILKIDRGAGKSATKFDNLIAGLKAISSEFKPDSSFNIFAPGSRLHKLLVHLADIEAGEEYDLDKFSAIFGLRFFHTDEDIDNKFRNLYVADAFLRELRKVSKDDGTFLEAVKAFRDNYAKEETHNISYGNFVDAIKQSITDETPDAQAACFETFFDVNLLRKAKASESDAGAGAAAADEDAEERRCLVM